MLEPWAKMTIAVAGTATIAVSQMFLIHRPGERRIGEVLASQEGVGFSYPEVGATRTQAPVGYQMHRERFALGSRPGAFERARQAIGRTRHRSRQHGRGAGASSGILVAPRGADCLRGGRAAEIRLCLRHSGGARGIGRGMARVEQQDDHLVWYEVLAFSREKDVLAKIGYPFTRSLQRKFLRDSGLAMQRAVAHS